MSGLRVFRLLSMLVLVLMVAFASQWASAEAPSPPGQVLDAFDFRYLNAVLPQNTDSVRPSDVLTGRRGWRFAITNHYPTAVTSPTISVHSSLNPALFPGLPGGFPLVVSVASLGPEQTLNVPALENTNVGVTFTPGFAAARSVNPLLIPAGGTIQSLTVRVGPLDARYNLPNAHIAVGVSGNVLSATNPDTSGGESLDIAPSCPCPGGASWMIHRAILGKDYVFTAQLQVGNSAPVPVPTRPEVRVEMTSHSGGADPEPAPNTSVTINDGALAGSIVYSIRGGDRTWHRVADDYFVTQFPSVRGPVRVKVDVKPGSDPNSINLKQRGAVAVAILSVTPEQARDELGPLDATVLDPTKIRLIDAADFRPGMFPAGAAPVRGALEDVDGDGDRDLVLIFETENLVADGLLDENTTAVRIYGPAVPATPPVDISGQDSVRIVPMR